MRIEPHFFAEAKNLRREFEKNFENPLVATEKRFVWDYWYVKDHYQHFRTPAFHYFSKGRYLRFHRQLVLWGRQNLGCWDVSPPWLSYYINGCRQNVHQDVPHGPWAFVYSLTPSVRRFRGGETILFTQSNPLLYQPGQSRLGRAARIPAKFDQLLVFDPRLPHGVNEVHGTMDPLEARLVIHGWFTEPKTFVEGALKTSPRELERALNLALEQVQEAAEGSESLMGTLALRLAVDGPSGRVKRIYFPTQNLWSRDRGQSANQMLTAVEHIYGSLRFGAKKSDSNLTIPLLFSGQ